MDAIIDIFDNIPTTFRASILIGGLVFFWILEGLIPLYTLAILKESFFWDLLIKTKPFG